jgi:hypothetical protein
MLQSLHSTKLTYLTTLNVCLTLITTGEICRSIAPIAVSGLEKLIVMSYQPRMDLQLNTESLSSGSYEFIKYQKNFQTNLLQIGHQGYLAFLNAHVNIDKIRMYNSKVSSHIKDAVRYLMSKNEL